MSRPQQAASGGGLERQGASALAWCRANGYELDTELALSDPGRSAYSGAHIKRGALGEFLQLAQAGALGDSPVLVVEAIDRLSRQEPIDALHTILEGLVRSGVRIVTLEDGNEYSKQTLHSDATKLIVLVVKIQQAYEYSARLSMRMKAAAEQQRALAVQGGNKAKARRPFWIDYNPKDDCFVLNERAKTAVRVYELLESGMGMVMAARALNQEGHKAPKANQWTRSIIQTFMRSEAPIGTAIFQRDSAEPLRVLNYYPVIIEPKRREQLLRVIRSRFSDRDMRGRRGKTRWIGQGLTLCVCGGKAGMQTATKKTRIKGKCTHYYVRCKNSIYPLYDSTACYQKSFKLRPLTAHILTRLSAQQLNTLFEQTTTEPSELRKELTARDALEGNLAEARSEAERAAAKVKEGAKAGVELSLLGLLNDASEEAKQRTLELEKALNESLTRLDALQQRPSAEIAAKQLQPAVQDLLRAFATQADTPEQRFEVNNLLRRLQIRIHVDANRKLCGLQYRNGKIDWQPVIDSLSDYTLSQGVPALGGRYENLDLPEDIAAAIGEDNTLSMQVDSQGRIRPVVIGPDGHEIDPASIQNRATKG